MASGVHDAPEFTTTFWTGVILHTTDGGNSWDSQTSGTSQRLYAVYFTDVQNGTTVAGYHSPLAASVILHTSDGGITWTTQSSGTTNDLFAVSFIDANTGVVVGDAGTILRTTNGGGAWIEQTRVTDNSLFGVCLITATTGVIVGAGGTVLRTTTGGVSSIESNQRMGFQTRAVLHQNYPNPFTPSTSIRYELPATAKATLTICNALGQEIARLVDDLQRAGRHQVLWSPEHAPAGVYFYRLSVGEYAQTRQLLLLR